MSDWYNEPIKSTGFDAQIKHEDGYELHFYTDRLEAYRAVEKVCQEQIDRKPKTHGDELRTMTDEELAALLANEACPTKESIGSIGRCKRCKEFFHFCDSCWLDWLKQEVSDNG